LTPRGCETIPFGIKALFDLHLDWVMMQINIEKKINVSQVVIYREL
jgi:hypothetical protein